MLSKSIWSKLDWLTDMFDEREPGFYAENVFQGGVMRESGGAAMGVAKILVGGGTLFGVGAVGVRGREHPGRRRISENFQKIS